MSPWVGIGVGIGIGLAVACIVAFAKKTWQTWLSSVLRNMLARTSVDITGDYAGEFWEEAEEEDPSLPCVGDGPDGRESITLKQSGRHISGTITRDIVGGPDRVSRFNGECADRHITATYKSTDPKNPERGSFCLKITNGGKTLRGGYLWYNTSEGKESVDYGTYIWTRKL